MLALEVLGQVVLLGEGDGAVRAPVPRPAAARGAAAGVVLDLLADDVLHRVPLLLGHKAASQQVTVTALNLTKEKQSISNKTNLLSEAELN